MEDVARFVIRPPLRCAEPLADSAFAVCGKAARWQRSPRGELAALFFCDEHRGELDVPISDGARFLRVSLVAELLYTATHPTRGMAQGEALRRLEWAVEESGGIVNLQAAHSVIGCWAPAGARHAHPPVGDRA